MSKIVQRGATAPLEVFQTSTDIQLSTMVGSRFDLSDGREVVLAQNGGTALVAGHLVQSVPDTANHIGLVVTAYTAATTQVQANVTVTLGGTAVLANEYQGGYAIVATSTGIGQTFKIASHVAQATTTGNVTIYLEDAPAVALTTSSTVSLFRNPYGSLNGTGYSTNGVVVFPTTVTGRATGICFYAIAASSATVATYGLLQTRGNVACLNQGSTTIGLDLMPSASVAGALCTYVVATKQRIGTATQAGTDTQASLTTVQL